MKRNFLEQESGVRSQKSEVVNPWISLTVITVYILFG